MKKLLIFSMLLASFSYAAKCSIIDELVNSRINGTEFTGKLDDNTKIKVEKIDSIFKDVLKTSHQLVPKHVEYIDITGVKKEDMDKARDHIIIMIRANSTINPDLLIYLDKNQSALEDIKNLLKELEIPSKNIHEYSNSKELVSEIEGIYMKNKDDFKYSRVLLFTRLTNIRIAYANLINSLDGFNKDITVDNYSYLDGVTRKSAEIKNIEEIKEAYKKLDCIK